MWTIIIPSLLRDITNLSLILNDIYSLPYAGSVEVIVIVDRSASKENKTRVAELEFPLRIFYSKFSGPGILRNEGVSLASGDYISFFDDDDRVEKTGVSFSFQADITLLGFKHNSAIFRNADILRSLSQEGLSKTGELLDIAADIEYVFSYCQPFVFSKDLVRRFKFHDARVMEDIDFISHILASNQCFSICGEISYRYIHHDGSTKALSGEDIYKSANEISSRLVSLSEKFDGIAYFQLVKRYSIAVRRARFFEVYYDCLDSDAEDARLVLSSTENWANDLFFWKSELKYLQYSSRFVGIYCKNNLSGLLYSYVNSAHKFVIDDLALTFRAEAHIITFEEFLANCEEGFTVFVAHAHPKLLSNTRRSLAARFLGASAENVRSLLPA